MKHKLKRIIPTPNSFFMDVKCANCSNVTTIFSHSHTSVTCEQCDAILCHTTGGKTRLREGSSFCIKN